MLSGCRPYRKSPAIPATGYAPYDYFDLGDFDQKGGVKTLYGNRAELEALIAKAHKNNIGLYADMVINHNSGADEEEVNPLDGQKRWTKFNPKSGRFPRDWNCFHPSRYEQVMIEGENFGGFPHLCHRNPLVYTEMFNYARLLIEELGFDGFRFDFAKGFGAWMIGMLVQVPLRQRWRRVHALRRRRDMVGHRGHRPLARSWQTASPTTRSPPSTFPSATS